MLFDLARHLLFRLPADTSHELTLHALAAAERARLLSCVMPRVAPRPVRVSGLVT